MNTINTGSIRQPPVSQTTAAHDPPPYEKASQMPTPTTLLFTTIKSGSLCPPHLLKAGGGNHYTSSLILLFHVSFMHAHLPTKMINCVAEGCNREHEADPTEDQMGLYGNTRRVPEDVVVCPFMVIAVTGAASLIVVVGHASAFPEESLTTLGACHCMQPPRHRRN